MDLFEESHSNFIKILTKNKVEYMLIGGHSVNLHGYPRATGDLDIWINDTKTNGESLIKSIEEFGFDTSLMMPKDFEKTMLFTLGSMNEPNCIEITNRIAGLKFVEAYKNHITLNIDDFEFKMISFDDLIKNKKASARYKDLDDVDQLLKNKEK